MLPNLKGDFGIKDIFYMMLGSILITSLIGVLTIGGWEDSNSSQSPKPISKQDKRTVTEDVLKLIDEDKVKRFDVIEKQQEQKKKVKYRIFEVTAYTAGYESTGKTPDHPNYGETASGTYVKEGRTIACPKSMEFGTKIRIPYFNKTFTCEDRGSAITQGKLDVYMKDLDQALNFGRRNLKIKILH